MKTKQPIISSLKIIRIRNIPADTHTALKKRAIDEGISMEALVLRWIEEKLA